MIARMVFSGGAVGAEQFTLDQGVPEVDAEIVYDDAPVLLAPDGTVLFHLRNPVGFW